MNRRNSTLLATWTNLTQIAGVLMKAAASRTAMHVLASILFGALLVAGLAPAVVAQPPPTLSSGENHDDTVLPKQASTSTFTAAVGDRIILQLGKLTGGAGFTPKMELFGPD